MADSSNTPNPSARQASMVERVAKAICASYAVPEAGEDPDLFWKGNEENHRATARAAIAAMREPTEAMLDAGPGDPYLDNYVWSQIIDSALAEGR